MDQWKNASQGAGYPTQQWTSYGSGPAPNPPYTSEQQPTMMGSQWGHNPSNVSPPGPPAPSAVEEFTSDFRKVLLQGQPKVLGALQIFISCVHIILAAIVIQYDPSVNTVTVLLWSNIWGVPFYIISGSLSIVVENNPNPSIHLVKAFMAMNIISALAALGTFVIFSYDLWYLTTYFTTSSASIQLYISIIVFMILANLLEFCVTISLSVFGGRAKPLLLRQSPNRQVFSLQNQYENPMTTLPAPAFASRTGIQSPYSQPQNYEEDQDSSQRFPMSSAQFGLKKTPSLAQPNYNNDGDNRMYNRYPGNNMQYNNRQY